MANLRATTDHKIDQISQYIYIISNLPAFLTLILFNICCQAQLSWHWNSLGMPANSPTPSPRERLTAHSLHCFSQPPPFPNGTTYILHSEFKPTPYIDSQSPLFSHMLPLVPNESIPIRQSLVRELISGQAVFGKIGAKVAHPTFVTLSF